MVAVYHLVGPDGTHYANSGPLDPNTFPLPVAGGSWVEGEAPVGSTYYIPVSPLQKIESLITAGQKQINPALPLDIQKQIYDLEVFVQNYYKRGATALITQTINDFTIDPNRTDVTPTQRTSVEALKTQMLEVLNAAISA